MINAWNLRKRKSPFRVNEWILDSGAFSQISRFGQHKISEEEYLDLISRFAPDVAVCQDWMCEPFILKKTGKSKAEHQWLTIQSYVSLSQWSGIHIMPVLQGFDPADYIAHLRMYGDYLAPEAWVGVGSVCKRNGNPDAIEDVLLGIKQERPDLRLHGFGIKKEALSRASVRALLWSADSMAWQIHARYEGKDHHDPRLALAYAARVEKLIDSPCFVQEQLFQWWHEIPFAEHELPQPRVAHESDDDLNTCANG